MKRSDPWRWPGRCSPVVSGQVSASCAQDSTGIREYEKIQWAVVEGDSKVLDAYGGVQAALRRAVELERMAEDGSRRVVIGGFTTWQSRRLATPVSGSGRARRDDKSCTRT